MAKEVICRVLDGENFKVLVIPSDVIEELGCELGRSVLIKSGTSHPYGEEYFKAVTGDHVLSGLYKLIDEKV
jgi:hypothetical protein